MATRKYVKLTRREDGSIVFPGQRVDNVDTPSPFRANPSPLQTPNRNVNNWEENPRVEPARNEEARPTVHVPRPVARRLIF